MTWLLAQIILLFTVMQVKMVLDWILVSASNESELKKLKM
jgi:hypothetical protein